jgi:hypothetical protein
MEPRRTRARTGVSPWSLPRAAAVAAAMMSVAVAGSAGLAAGPARAAGCPNAEMRAAQDAERLPDCRAYELVSPAFKGGFDPTTGGGYADDGSAVGLVSTGSFAGTLQGRAGNNYTAVRSASGWVTTSHAPAPSNLVSIDTVGGSLLDKTPDQQTELWARAPRLSRPTRRTSIFGDPTASLF